MVTMAIIGGKEEGWEGIMAGDRLKAGTKYRVQRAPGTHRFRGRHGSPKVVSATQA